ncbi:hypothetical protein [Nesterenkonia alba]|uniref:hypothetical protein n=1 Tax=Nesterenkonia alba TaxID=515814 RepID=UPI0003B64573|nr:hypothetical protein [Nesterenkonia alba]
MGIEFNAWWEIVALTFGSVAALLFLIYGIMWIFSDDEDEKPHRLDTTATVELLADVTAEAHAQGVEAQRALDELRELAPQLEAEDWDRFEKQYRQTLEAFSSGQSEVEAQMDHLERIFRRDRIIGRARRELREM